MEKFELLDKSNMYSLKELMENDNMVYDINQLNEFIETEGMYGFIYILDNKPIGLAYCCRLIKPDGYKEIYLHSIDILPSHQNKGYGTKFFKEILQYSRKSGFSKLFLCTTESLKQACRMYDKCDGKRDCNDDIIYSYDLTE